MFDDTNCYLNNLTAYMKTALDNGHHVIIIENETIYNEALDRVKDIFPIDVLKHVHHIDNHTFYLHDEKFTVHNTLKNFQNIIEPFINEKVQFRTWSHVLIKEDANISCKLFNYEKLADSIINQVKIMCVCSYSASEIPASLQTALMRTHEYLMTDHEFVRSTMYKS